MNTSNRLLELLDAVFGFPNKASSHFKKVKQAFDNRTQEHVVWIEYRVKVNNPPAARLDTVEGAKLQGRKLDLMRELLGLIHKPG